MATNRPSQSMKPTAPWRDNSSVFSIDRRWLISVSLDVLTFLVKLATRRRLLWFGVVLVLLSTIFIVITLFQAREYTSSVSVEVGKPGVIASVGETSRDTRYAILFLVGIFLPGSVLLIAALLSYFSERNSSRAQHI